MTLVLLAACRQEPVPTPLMDTGWFTDTDDATAETCPHYVLKTEPSDGEADWYWRDAVTVSTNTPAVDFYDAKLATADGTLVADAEVWGETGFSLDVDALGPSTDYVLQVDDCRGRTEVSFHTSAFGTPLDVSNLDLIGTTWRIDLMGADWVEPGGFSALLALYFTVPIMVGVQWADASHLDLLGASGYEDSQGKLHQDATMPTFDFPLADFSGSPWFEARTDKVVFSYSGFDVPVTEFLLEATLSADASELGGGIIEGLADTRYLGGTIDPQNPDPAVICDLAASVGALCEDCPDGENYCLYLLAEDVIGERVDGLSLTP